MIRVGRTFVHRGVTWKVARIGPEWIYCRAVKGRPTNSVMKHYEPDGTLAWCRESVAKRMKD